MSAGVRDWPLIPPSLHIVGAHETRVLLLASLLLQEPLEIATLIDTFKHLYSKQPLACTVYDGGAQ